MTILAVLLGGALGTALRLGIDTLLPHTDDAFPFSTLLINTVGAFALGALVARVWPTAPDWLRAGLGAGLLGSFTTFSAVAVSLISMTSAGEWMPAALYLVATLLLGLGAAWLGLRAGRTRASGVAPIDTVNE
ncbi:MAG: CrcB family protein [Rhodoglobus sp.]|nr:CrcB family protein [Rhodoglobus sp.]